MRYLLLLTIPVLLGATLSAGAAADLSAAGASQVARPTCFGQRATLVGTRGDDVIVGTPQRDVVVARAGNDVVRSRGGGDVVCGGAGDDRIVDGRGGRRDQLFGGPGDDRLTSTGHSAFFSGGAGTDVLTVAGTGETLLDLTADGDQVRTRTQRTRRLVVLLTYGSIPGPIEVDLAAGTVRRAGAATGDEITHVSRPPREMVVGGTAGNDRMSGRNGRDFLFGFRGNDNLTGRGGPDVLDGGPGDDVLDGGKGTDSASGGKGTDTCTNAENLTGCSP